MLLWDKDTAENRVAERRTREEKASTYSHTPKQEAKKNILRRAAATKRRFTSVLGDGHKIAGFRLESTHTHWYPHSIHKFRAPKLVDKKTIIHEVHPSVNAETPRRTHYTHQQVHILFTKKKKIHIDGSSWLRKNQTTPPLKTHTQPR